MANVNITSRRNFSESVAIKPSWQVSQSPAMPAWVPAVSVAITMLLFLAASFYIRHRKVVKKRQILMDYFYVILQYGGLRRKRMVTALCNSNDVKLRHLGRSFMLSFDNNENSCPFYLEDSTAFTKSANPVYAQSKSTPKPMNRFRAPFKRVMSQIDDSGLLMKFKSKKRGSSMQANRQGLSASRKMSLVSIYDKGTHYRGNSEQEYSPQQGQRSDVFGNIGSKGYILSMNSFRMDSDEQSLANVTDEYLASQIVSNGKRKSYPNISSDGDDEEYRVVRSNPRNLRVFQLGTNSSLPYSRNSYDRQMGKSHSKKEPLILVHAASNDISSSQESVDEQNPCSNGVVLLRRVSRDNSRQDYYYVNESPVPSHNKNKRASVSYVQSSNINDYYQHCFQSSTHSINSRVEDDEFHTEDETKSSRFRNGFSLKKNSPPVDSQRQICIPPRRKCGRLSLGEIGIGNFNKRIEESLGSMHEPDSEGSCGKLSKEFSDERKKSHTTWKRLKNVFAGIRWSRQGKTQMSEERNKLKSKRYNNTGKWNRFFKSLTGFRSFPEDKKDTIDSGGPKSSKSLPIGLDKHSTTLDDYEFHIATQMTRNCRNVFSKLDSTEGKRIPPKTRSFPDNILFYQGDTRPCLFHLPSDPIGTPSYQKSTSRKNKNRLNTCDDHLHSRSDFEIFHSPLHQNVSPFFQESSARAKRHQSACSFSRASSPVSRKEDRRYRSLSPLPERQSSSSSRKGKNVKWYSHSERNSLSERGLLMSPQPQTHCNRFLFSAEIPSTGGHLGNIMFDSDCPLGSCGDVSASTSTLLLNVMQRDQAAPGGSAVDPFTGIGVTTTTDTSVTQTDKHTGTAGEGTVVCGQKAEDTNGTNPEGAEHTCNDVAIDAKNKYSCKIHDETNSSMDSIYFDTFSIPGSPRNSLEEIVTSVNKSTTSAYKSRAIQMSSSRETLLPARGSSPSFATNAVVNHTDGSTESPFTSCAEISKSEKLSKFGTQNYAPPSIYSITHLPMCDLDVSSSIYANRCPLSSHPVDILSNSSTFDKSDICRKEIPFSSYYDEGRNDIQEDSIDETKPLIDPVSFSSPTIEQTQHQQQPSISEDSCLGNFSRLSRFGKRANSVSAGTSTSGP